MPDGDYRERKDHRCIDCVAEVQHRLDEICSSCGRCAEHCKKGPTCDA